MADPAEISSLDRMVETIAGTCRLEAGVAYQWRIVCSDDPNVLAMEITRQGDDVKAAAQGPNRHERRKQRAEKQPRR